MLGFVCRLTKFAMVLLLLVASVLVAQQLANPPGAPDSCLRRSIPVSFVKNVETPPPLRVQDLQVAVKGDQAAIISVVQEKHTPRVILLMDTSGSMRSLPPEGHGWGFGVQTAKFAADAIPPGASVAFGTFSEQLQLSEFHDGTSFAQQVFALGKRRPDHTTALFDAVSDASSLFKTPQFGDAIYVVTDGGDNRSSISLSRLEDKLVARGVRVFVFLVNAKPPFRTPEERQGLDDMEDLAQNTGGGLIALVSKEWFTQPEAALTAKSIRDQVASPYRMELQLTSPLSKPAKLSVNFPREPRAYTIVYPRRLEPCTKSVGR